MGKKCLKMSTPREVQKAVSRVANMVLNGEIEAKDANAIMYAANVILGSIKTIDQQKKLDDLEKMMEEIKRK